MTTYAAVAAAPQAVATALSGLGPPSASEYYRLRALDPMCLDIWTRAARFLFLNRFCFNGLYRTDRRDRFNVPFGATRAGRLPTAEELCEYGATLSAAELVAADFEETVDRVGTGDFVYMDPPYAVKEQWRRGRHYTGDAFAVDDVGRLRDAMHRIDAEGAVFLVSYADSDEGRSLGVGWTVQLASVRRSIAGSAFKRVAPRSALCRVGLVDGVYARSSRSTTAPRFAGASVRVCRAPRQDRRPLSASRRPARTLGGRAARRADARSRGWPRHHARSGRVPGARG